MTVPITVTRHTRAINASIAEELGIATAMSAAWDQMAASAMRFDGSYERARDRFRAIAANLESGE